MNSYMLTQVDGVWLLAGHDGERATYHRHTSLEHLLHIIRTSEEKLDAAIVLTYKDGSHFPDVQTFR